MLKTKTQKIVTAGILFAVILIMQAIKNISAFISGPVINTAIALAAVAVGFWWGIGFSIITPLTSMLLAPASPMTAVTAATGGANLPVIMIGNVIFVLLVYFGYKKGTGFFIGGIVLGAVLKWLFMWGCADLVIKPLFSEALGEKVAVIDKIFSTLQLYAGLLSGILIFPITKALEKAKFVKKPDKA